MADMADMGHRAGMDMQAMVRDMRNRFWICLVFSIPIFAYSTGMDFVRLEPPFGLDLNVFIFLLATAAIVYPAWPFVVGAVRALRNGVLSMSVLILLSVGTGYLFSVGLPSFSRASSSSRHRPCCSYLFCSVIGWRCGRGQERRTRSGCC
jgi:Cu2+-exporting ATPase